MSSLAAGDGKRGEGERALCDASPIGWKGSSGTYCISDRTSKIDPPRLALPELNRGSRRRLGPEEASTLCLGKGLNRIC